jgi:hypothetical protein
MKPPRLTPPQITDLSGRDYLTEKEAARYCGVSLSWFRRHRQDHGIPRIWHMKKVLYRREDLARSIENNA